MQPVVPYQLTQKLGACQIGGIWSAVDEQQRSLVVAVLDAGVAGESRWRDAFAAATNAIARSSGGGPAYLGADFSAATPWVAYPSELLATAERTFLALGMTYEPASGHADDPATADQHARPHAEPKPTPTDGSPATADWTPSPTDRPLAAVDRTPPPMPALTSPPPGPPHDSRPTDLTPAASRPGAGRWALPAAGLVLGLLAGGGLVTLVDPGTDPPRPQPSVSSASLPEPASAAPPLNPGLEPPAEGTWPAQWVRFSPTDRVLTLTGLDGLTFPVKVPLTWRCTAVERARGLSRHQCGGPADNGAQLGGELIVRDCPAPCDGPRQTAMRTAEEAWGLRWVRSGPSSTYAETSSLTVDGERRYGLVVVAYWRSGDGDVDRQLVLRMTAPVTGANQLRRVANYLRDVLLF